MPAPQRPSRKMSATFRSTTSCLPTGSARARSSRRFRLRSTRLGIPHPLHVHCNNLGAPGAADTAAATIAAAEGVPLHLAHLQFYGYGTEGKRKFSSAAARLAELVNGTPEVTIDIGQVMFGQTVTISSDVLRQFSARGSAHPKKSVIYDGDGNGGGIVPFRYTRGFLRRCAMGGRAGAFPPDHRPLAGFLHDRPPERRAIHRLSAAVRTADEPRRTRRDGREPCRNRRWRLSTLASIEREYTLEEIAIMTRAAPAKLLGLKDRGHLGAGAIADVAVYRKDRTSRRCSGERPMSSRMAISS